MPLPLEGQVAVVTGSSRGIGKAIALQLARDGADIVVCARTEQATDERPGSIGETANEVRALGRRALAVKLDVTNDAEIRSMAGAAIAEFGRIDILVNNAGVMGGGAAFLGGDPGILDHFYRTNVRAPYVLSQVVGARMAEAGRGVIVNISSGAARAPAPPSGSAAAGGANRGAGPAGLGPVYGVSKAALDRLGTGIAGELAQKNIAVITIYPGFTITERVARTLPPGADTSRAERPETTAKAVAFLCRDPMQHTGRILSAREVVDQNGL
jgi:NAD(P)-dependent dehydrogenase (short-subunit alcohol dehydrogenase family)